MSGVVDLVMAHRHCWRHRAAIESSGTVGCFHCLRLFDPSTIIEWIDDDQTAICPHCRVDSILPEDPSYALSDDFLARMRKCWFGADSSCS